MNHITMGQLRELSDDLKVRLYIQMELENVHIQVCKDLDDYHTRMAEKITDEKMVRFIKRDEHMCFVMDFVEYNTNVLWNMVKFILREE